MGFTPPPRIYNLKFADAELEGLEVKIKAMSVAQIFGIMDLADIESQGFSADSMNDLKKVFELLEEILVAWNIETPEGEPLPTTLRGIQTLEFDFVFMLLMTAVEEIIKVSAPKEKASTDGEPSAVPQIPMAQP